MDRNYLVDSTVEIRNKERSTTLGTGFWVTFDGFILTCWHVIRMSIGNTTIYWKGQEYPAEYYPEYSWIEEDIAVLKVCSCPGNVCSVPLGCQWEIGDNVWSFGFQYYSAGWRGYSSSGSIIGPLIHKDVNGNHELIGINSDVEKGLSGSMLFDVEKNRVVGIVLWKIEADSKIDFGAAIPIKKVFQKWPKLEELNKESTYHILIDFTPYIDRYIYDYEHFNDLAVTQKDPIIETLAQCDLKRCFVQLRGIDSAGNEINPIDEYIANWIEDPTRRHVTILGDFGTGKSSYGLKLTYDLAKKFKENPVLNPIPLFVPLGLFSKTNIKEFERFIADELLPQYGIYLKLFSDLMELWSSGKLFLFLDGFDEMSSNKDRISIRRNFNDLRRIIRGNSKSILTCRANYFKHDLEVSELASFDSGVGLEAQYELFLLKNFNEEQIILFLKKNSGEDWAFYWDKIKENYDLSDLSKRPILLHMIVKSLPQLIKPGRKINIGNLYEIYTSECFIKSDRDERITILKMEERSIFMRELAYAMFIQWKESISLNELLAHIAGYFTHFSSSELELVERDIRTCTFLHRKRGSDLYRFIHRTFMAFFTAQKIIHDLIENSSYESLAKKPLTPEILTFFIDIVENKKNSSLIIEELFEFIEMSKMSDFDREKNKYLAANSISLLNKMKVELSNCDFSNAFLISADLSNTNLRNTSFLNSDLEGVNFTGSDLRNCNLKNASVKDVYLGRSEEIRMVVYSPDGKTLLSAHSDNKIKLWDSISGKEIGCIKKAHTQKVNCVCFSPVKKYFASSSNDMTIKIWKYEENEDGEISLNQEPALEFYGHQLSVESICFDPGGRYLFSGSYDNTARRWDIEHPINSKCRILDGHKNAVFSINSDHHEYVVTGSWDFTVKVWKVFLTKTKCIQTFIGHTKPVFCVAVNPLKDWVASGSSDFSLRVWEIETGNNIFTYEKHYGSVRSVTFSPDGSLLASGCWDSKIRIWNTSDWKLLYTFSNQNSPVWGVRFSPDSKRLVSCDADGNIKIWSVKDGVLKRVIKTSNSTISPDYQGLNITRLRGCSNERKAFFKEHGAFEEE